MKNNYLYFYVFCTGMVITGIEIAASRLLAPFFGSSTFVWAVIITIIMLGLAIGYWWGGRIADKYHSKIGIFKLGLIAGLFVAIIPFLSKMIFTLVADGFINTPINVTVLVFCMSLFLFLPAIIVLGFMSPYVTRILIKDVRKAGNVAGNVYAISTFGCVIGILLATFLMIPFLGTRETIAIFSAILIFISALGLSKIKYFILLLLPILVYWYSAGAIKTQDNIVYQDETYYQYVEVVKENDTMYLVFDEGSGKQSIYDFSKKLSGSYYDYFIPLPNMIDKPEQNIVILGYAGGVIGKLINIYNENYKIYIDGVEIDKDVVAISKEYFKSNDENINVVVDDARNFIRESKKKYDIVILDVYTREIYIPYHLATYEFFNLVSQKLTPEGVFAANIISVDENSKLLGAMVKTISSAFENIYIKKIKNSNNYLVFASKKILDFDRLKDTKVAENIIDIYDDLSEVKIYDKNKFEDKQLLTDNRAPLEYLTDRLFFDEISMN